MTEARVPFLLPSRVFLTHQPEVTIARPTLGMVLYLNDPVAWAHQHVANVCARFLELVGTDRLHWFMTSTMDRWQPVKPDDVPPLIEQLRVPELFGRIRHWLLFRLVDDCGAPSVGFEYREVDPRRSPRLGYIRLTFPLKHSTDDLLALMLETQRLPRLPGPSVEQRQRPRLS
jgi:hypothetical protein